jgi:glutamyl-tRNA reductase (EC 1.2.1.70)
MHWLRQRDPNAGVVALIRDLQTQADAWRAAEIARAKRLLARGESVDAALEALARGLTQKMLHGALAELHSGDEAARQHTAEVVSRLFLRGRPDAAAPHRASDDGRPPRP